MITTQEYDQQFSGIPMFDGHADIWSDVSRRRQLKETSVFNNVHRDRFIEGNIFGGIFALWVNTEVPGDTASKFDSMLADLKAELAEPDNGMTIIDSAKTYKSAMMDFINDRAGYGNSKAKIATLLGIEGLDGINGRPEMMAELYQTGFRHLSLTWNQANDYGTGVQGPADRGLTQAGRDVLRFIHRHPMLLDVSHANDKTFWDIVGEWRGPIIASHSNAKALCDVPRNLTDKQIRAIGSSGGVVGLNTYGLFVSDDPASRTVEKLAEHAAHMADLVGVSHIALGFDFVEYLETDPEMKKLRERVSPAVLPDCSQSELMLKALLAKGFNERELTQIANGNFNRLMGKL